MSHGAYELPLLQRTLDSFSSTSVGAGLDEAVMHLYHGAIPFYLQMYLTTLSPNLHFHQQHSLVFNVMPKHPMYTLVERMPHEIKFRAA